MAGIGQPSPIIAYEKCLDQAFEREDDPELLELVAIAQAAMAEAGFDWNGAPPPAPPPPAPPPSHGLFGWAAGIRSKANDACWWVRGGVACGAELGAAKHLPYDPDSSGVHRMDSKDEDGGDGTRMLFRQQGGPRGCFYTLCGTPGEFGTPRSRETARFRQL